MVARCGLRPVSWPSSCCRDRRIDGVSVVVLVCSGSLVVGLPGSSGRSCLGGPGNGPKVLRVSNRARDPPKRPSLERKKKGFWLLPGPWILGSLAGRFVEVSVFVFCYTYAVKLSMASFAFISLPRGVVSYFGCFHEVRFVFFHSFFCCECLFWFLSLYFWSSVDLFSAHGLTRDASLFCCFLVLSLPPFVFCVRLSRSVSVHFSVCYV